MERTHLSVVNDGFYPCSPMQRWTGSIHELD